MSQWTDRYNSIQNLPLGAAMVDIESSYPQGDCLEVWTINHCTGAANNIIAVIGLQFPGPRLQTGFPFANVGVIGPSLRRVQGIGGAMVERRGR